MSLLDENLDWADYTHKSEMKKLILEKYNAIYKMISKGKRATEYRDNSHISRIKKSLKSFSDIVSNIDLFIPEKVFSDQRCCYNVPIPPNLVYVIEGPKGEEREVKMVDSEFWRSNLS